MDWKETWESYEPEANIDWRGIVTEKSSKTRIGKAVKQKSSPESRKTNLLDLKGFT